MSENFDHIPILDLESITRVSTQNGIEKVDRNLLIPLSKKLCDILHDVGFVYLKNHGVPQAKIDRIHSIGRKFFLCEKEFKMKFAKQKAEDHNGWVQMGNENYSNLRPGDYKECFDLIPGLSGSTMVPDEKELPGFQDAFLDAFHLCENLSHTILFLIGIGLNPEDPEIFLRHHKGPSANAARTIYYPPVKDQSVLLENQIGCGEHTDFGSITFVFQDDVGGLEVKNKKGEFVKATPIPGTVVMNVADSLQRWTADKLISTVHRVMPPKADQKARQSFAFFVHPDNDFTIECFDGSNKYEPINAVEFMNRRYSTSFK